MYLILLLLVSISLSKARFLDRPSLTRKASYVYALISLPGWGDGDGMEWGGDGGAAGWSSETGSRVGEEEGREGLGEGGR